MSISAGYKEDPELIDRKFDVLLFGCIPFFLQSSLKNADWESVWFYEQEDTPDNLYVCMKVRKLLSNSEAYDFIYNVGWTYHDIHYGANVHLLPRGVTSLVAGSLDAEGNDFLDHVECQENFDVETSIITWIIPKDEIGNPMKSMAITNILASTHVRFPLDSGRVKMDLFKDLPWNAISSKDYIIQY